ncbi:hypothetical protein [Xenorhabdus koppenhoeferi]|uniref:hypothetical protein n=1 Tax=Xenorhabdus koppenhoeferi TaxID=351659 RepID=UPI002B40B192|nr:hypothetical protein [Xenorhabdus sp. Vera]
MAAAHNDINQYVIQTRYANISVFDTGGEGTPVLLIHGNSSSVFNVWLCAYCH